MQTSIPLPRRTRTMIEIALREYQHLSAMAQMQKKQVDDLVEAAREMMEVPDDWTIEDVDIGFHPSDGTPT